MSDPVIVTVTLAPTPPAYSITPRAPGPWVDPKTGIPTREFYRFIVNLFQSAGSGQAGTNLAALMAQVQSLINGEASLEAAFTILNDYVLTQRAVDLSPVENAIQEVMAYVLASRKRWDIAAVDLTQAFLSPPALGGKTPAAGSFTTIGATGLISPTSTIGILGTATNDNALAGSIGEYASAVASNGTATVTITIASPGVVTWTAHGLALGSPVVFTTTGALPTGLTASTVYWVIPLTANTFKVATTIANAVAGTAIITTGTQSGTQTGTAAVPLTTATPADIAFLHLSDGDWDVEALPAFGPSGTNMTQAEGWTSATSATLPSIPNNGGFASIATAFGSAQQTLTVGAQRFSLAAPATVYLSVQAAFGSGTVSGYGFLRARRPR